MAIRTESWGEVDGREAHRFTLTGSNGARLVLSDYGAAATSLEVPAPSGETADIILGFDRLEDYRATPTYFGATVGRFANRIRRGRFVLDGEPHTVGVNEGLNHLHGGLNGYDKRLWSAELDPAANAVRFSLVSPAGDEGFPGTLQVSSTYRLADDGTLSIEMEAVTDAPTLCNLVHHSYFNLAGHASGTVLDQEIAIDADFYTPVDDELIITGEVLKVAGTPFDFRKARPIGSRLREVANGGAGRLAGPSAGGYDHNWCLRGEPGRLRPVLNARDPVSGRGFVLHTTEPGVHFYTGGYLDPSIVGKGGTPYRQFAGFTLETQKFPDGPNLGHVPQSRLNPGETYRHVMEFRFLS